MILTGPEIIRRRGLGEIVIEPFNAKHVNPNSVDLTLGDKLLVYKLNEAPIVDFTVGLPNGLLQTQSIHALDPRVPCPTQTVELPEPPDACVLVPGMLYLASTAEYTETHGLVPGLHGKSSLARMGISIHLTAGFGDHGFCGVWTCEVTVAHPVKVWRGMRFCQIAYQQLAGEPSPYQGRYAHQRGPVEARTHLDHAGDPPLPLRSKLLVAGGG